MSKPHQVKVSITYDGTSSVPVSQSSSNSNDSESTTTKTAQYKVVSGDTLWAIAQKYYGNGAEYTKIYEANKELIEATAASHGFKSSNGGHWIWPGEVLTIPGITTAVSSKKSSNKAPATDEANKQLGKKLSNHLTAFTYTDPASGESDSVSLTIDDIGKEWMDKDMPQRGAKLKAVLKLISWDEEDKTKKFNCGMFVLDDINFSGRPLTCTIGGVSKPATDDFDSLPKTKTWEKVTLQEIAEQVAKGNGVKLVYEAGTINIEEIEQSNQTDSAFLKSLCDEYDVSMKVYNSKVVMFKTSDYEKKKPIANVKESDMLQWSANTTVQGTYTGVRLTYTDPDDSSKKIDVTVGKQGRMYYVNKQADNEADARMKAQAELDSANRKICTMEITLRGRTDLVATQCINIRNLGKLSGKYYIDKVKHSVGNSGYRTSLSVHRVGDIESLAKKKTDKGTSNVENNMAKTEWQIGDRVKITGVYVSSDSTNRLKPAITEGTIERILLGTRNPYLVYSGSTGIGWVNAEDMSR